MHCMICKDINVRETWLRYFQLNSNQLYHACHLRSLNLFDDLDKPIACLMPNEIKYDIP